MRATEELCVLLKHPNFRSFEGDAETGATLSVWKAYKRGAYPDAAPLESMFEGRAVRLGGYGDPAAVHDRPAPAQATVRPPSRRAAPG